MKRLLLLLVLCSFGCTKTVVNNNASTTQMHYYQVCLQDTITKAPVIGYVNYDSTGVHRTLSLYAPDTLATIIRKYQGIPIYEILGNITYVSVLGSGTQGNEDSTASKYIKILN